jgi:hypothetical protein
MGKWEKVLFQDRRAIRRPEDLSGLWALPRYRQHPERLRYVEIEDSLHMMTPEDWAWSIREATGWLSRFTG